MRSGIVLLTSTSGTFREASEWGTAWSSYTNLVNGAYHFSFNPTTVYPSYGPSGRYYARPLRCLSTVLDM